LKKKKKKKERLEKKEKEKEKALANQPYEFKPQKEPDWMKNLGKKKTTISTVENKLNNQAQPEFLTKGLKKTEKKEFVKEEEKKT